MRNKSKKDAKNVLLGGDIIEVCRLWLILCTEPTFRQHKQAVHYRL